MEAKEAVESIGETAEHIVEPNEPATSPAEADSPSQKTSEVTIELAYEHTDEARSLIIEYMDWLQEEQDNMDECLARQNYDDELDHLGEKYGVPEGRLYVARRGEDAIGCIAMRPMPELPGQNACELKRLYVKPDQRGSHIGRRLVQRIVDDAREAGYSRIYLDTLPILQTAIHMYLAMGFEEIPQYNDNPIAEAVYMKMEL